MKLVNKYLRGKEIKPTNVSPYDYDTAMLAWWNDKEFRNYLHTKGETLDQILPNPSTLAQYYYEYTGLKNPLGRAAELRDRERSIAYERLRQGTISDKDKVDANKRAVEMATYNNFLGLNALLDAVANNLNLIDPTDNEATSNYLRSTEFNNNLVGLELTNVLGGTAAANLAGSFNTWAPFVGKYFVLPALAGSVVDETERALTGTTGSKVVSNYLQNHGWNPFFADLAGGTVNPGYWINPEGGKYLGPVLSKLYGVPIRNVLLKEYPKPRIEKWFGQKYKVLNKLDPKLLPKRILDFYNNDVIWRVNKYGGVGFEKVPPGTLPHELIYDNAYMMSPLDGTASIDGVLYGTKHAMRIVNEGDINNTIVHEGAHVNLKNAFDSSFIRQLLATAKVILTGSFKPYDELTYTKNLVKLLNDAYSFVIGKLDLAEKGATNRELRYVISNRFNAIGLKLNDIILNKLRLTDDLLEKILMNTNDYSNEFLSDIYNKVNEGANKSELLDKVRKALIYVPMLSGAAFINNQSN